MDKNKEIKTLNKPSNTILVLPPLTYTIYEEVFYRQKHKYIVFEHTYIDKEKLKIKEFNNLIIFK
jgi:hypothetical protein